MERGREKNYTLAKPPKGSTMTQDEHDNVDFGVSKLTERVVNLENTIPRKDKIMNMVK